MQTHLIKINVKDNDSRYAGQEFKFFIDRFPIIEAEQPSSQSMNIGGLSFCVPGRSERSITISNVEDDEFISLMMKFSGIPQFDNTIDRPTIFDFKLFLDVYKYDEDLEVSMAIRAIKEGGEGNIDLKDCIVIQLHQTYTADECVVKLNFMIGLVNVGLGVM